MSEAKPQPYNVRAIHIDYYYGLEGMLVIETRAPAARHEVGAGQSATVAPPTVHHVSNPGMRPCRFLLIQGVGKYDFVKI